MRTWWPFLWKALSVAVTVALAIATVLTYRSYQERKSQSTPNGQELASEPVQNPGQTQPDELAVRRGPSWRGDFETGDLSQWDVIEARDDRITIVDDPVRQGRQAAAFEVRPGDMIARGERAELVKITQEGEGDESWWAWSVFFPSQDFFSDPARSTMFTRWHDLPAGEHPPPVLFEVRDEALTLTVRGGLPERPSVRRWEFAELELDRWYDFMFHARWSSSPRGLVELYVDGKRVVRSRRPTLYTGKENYLKQGNYRFPYSRRSVLYQDGARRAASMSGLETE